MRVHFIPSRCFSVCRLSHYPVNNQQEQKGRQGTSLVRSGEHLDQFGKDSIVDDCAAAVVVGLLYKGDLLILLS